MDITTLVYYALMGLALVGADAYLFADSITARVEVAKKYADSAKELTREAAKKR